MQRCLVAREINPDVLIKYSPSLFRCKKEASLCIFFIIFFFAAATHVCVCVCVPRAGEHTGRTDKKNVLINMLPTLQGSCHWLGF